MEGLGSKIGSLGRVAIGTWLKIPDPITAELAALGGFDFVVVDLEHSPMSIETASRLIAASAVRGVPPLVRVPDHAGTTIQRSLDAGAAGVVVPHVDDADQASAVVAAVRFPPSGRRGFSPSTRAGGWGLVGRDDCLRSGADAMCVPQLESGSAMAAADEIIAVAGVDAVLIGPADLALDLGVMPEDDVVTRLIASVVERCRRWGVLCGIAVGADPAAVGRFAAQGFSFVVASNDTTLLVSSERALVQAAHREL